MSVYFLEEYGNPNSIHSLGRRARAAVDDARARIARCLGMVPSEIVFNGGGTEANNVAIRGAAVARRGYGHHIVTTAIEHVSTLRTCARLREEGYDVTTVRPDEYGRIDANAVAAAVRRDTVLVTLAQANNEIGTIQPIGRISSAVKRVNPRVLIHCDAVQTAGHLPIDANELGVDLMTLTAHKFYGPKGIGAVYVRSGVELAPMLFGGGDEKRLRVGTESVPLAVGMAVALERACATMVDRDAEWRPIRDAVIAGLRTRLSGVMLNGHPVERLAANMNVSIAGVNGEDFVLLLDRAGVCASTGSACSTGQIEPSHVLLAIGRDRDEALGALRLTFGDASRGVDVEWLIDTIVSIALRQRSIAPMRTYAYADAGGNAEAMLAGSPS
jgi:cysteine desulfurase